jgi:hypothetical protein
MTERFLTQPTAQVYGGSAWLLSRILRSPAVIKVLDNPPAGMDRSDIAATALAIHAAGRAWESDLTLQRRDTAIPLSATVPHCLTTEQAGSYLRLSVRRIQELAPSLGGKRIGRRWSIPAAAVQQYGQRKATRAA